MDTNKLNLVTNEYDDGVVCFGPVTESQLNRYNRLPRRTVLPSDFELSQSVFEPDEDKTNDKSTVLDGPNENTTTCVDNSIHITQSTNNFEEEKEVIGTIELKQSISVDSNTRFSSPRFSKYIPNAKLIDTEVINRYIRMGSISSNESSLSEDQNKSTFEDETVSFTDTQEAELIQDNYVYDETSSCEHLSVSSVIEQSASINQQNVMDDSNNVCTLIHCSQKDDTDLSICSDLELEDVAEDSIVSDEYTITPGKQRLFDLRLTKQSFRSKALVASAPFMDRIEETTTPVLPKVLNSPLILNDISYRHIKTKESLNVSSITETRHGTSSKENVFETSMFDETTNSNKLSTDSRNMNINKSLNKTDQIESTLNNTEHIFDNEQSMKIVTDTIISTHVSDHCDKEYLTATQLDIKSTDIIAEGEIFDETMYTDKHATNNVTIDFNQTLNETDHIQSTLNDTEHNFGDQKSMCILSYKTIPTLDINCHNDEEFLVDMEVDIKSTNTSYVDNEFDETNKHSMNNQIMDFNKSLNDTHHVENTLNDNEENLNDEKSKYIESNIAILTSGINDYNDEENSIATEADNKSINTSVVDKIVDDTVYTNKLSTNNQSMDFNKSLIDTNHIENTLNDTEHNFDDEQSVYILSNKTIPTLDVNNQNDEEFSIAMEVDIKSTNTSYVDNEFDETNKHSMNNQIMDFNKSLNDTHHVENTLNDNEDNLNYEKSKYIESNNATVTSGINDYKDEENSIATEADNKSINTSVVDKIFDDTVYTNKLSTTNQSMDLNKSLIDTNHIENTLNDTEHNFDDEQSVCILSNNTIPTLDVNSHNDEEFSVAMEVDITTNTSCVDNGFDETNKHSMNNQIMDFNKSLNDTHHVENTLNDNEENLNDEKSKYIESNIAILTSGINDYKDEENLIATEADNKSINTSVVDKIFDDTVYTNKLSTTSQSMDLNKYINGTDHIKNTLNDTEHNFDDEQSVCILSNKTIPTLDVNSQNDEEFSVAMEVDIKSTNPSYVDNGFDETNKYSTDNQIMDFNKSLNDTHHVENTLNDNEDNLNDEMSKYIESNNSTVTSGINDNKDEENSIATEVDNKSINTSAVDKIFDEKSMNNLSNMAIPTSDVNDHKDEFSVDITSTNTSHEDKGFDETKYTNKLSINNKSVNFNKSINETEHKFMNNGQNNTVTDIHFDDKMPFCKQDNSILKNTINSDTSFVENNEVNITCNTSLEDPSYRMRQYLDFEQAVNEMCSNISSANCQGEKLINPKTSYDDETLEHLIEQTLSSGTFTLSKANENFSSYDRSNLSVIIENKSLETSSNNIEQNEDFVIPNNDIPITLESESIVNEIKDNTLLNKSTVENTVATSKYVVSIDNGTDNNIQIETKHNGSSMFSDELPKMELDIFTEKNKNLNNITTKQMFIPEDVNEICSKQNTLDENNLNPVVNQINITDIPNSTAFSLIPETEKTKKNIIDQNEILNENQPLDLLDTTKSIDNSLEEFSNLEQMFNFGDDKKEEQVKYQTPKTQKLLDFSIVQQTPTFINQAKTQKLLNFSIVDQTPILKSTQQTKPNENIINNESLINFSSVDQMWNSEVVLKDEINFKDFKNSSNDFSSNNLSSISSPNVELLVDESIRTYKSNCSNSSFNQTITDSYLSQSAQPSARNNTQNHITELNNVEPLVLTNSQLVANEPSNSINQTIEQNGPKQKTFSAQHCMSKAFTEGVKSDLKLLSNTTLNKNIDSAGFKEDLNQELCFGSNKRAIVDFSIIDQGTLEKFELKNNTDKTSVESNRNISNLIEMSLVSSVTKSDEQSINLSENSIIAITSNDRSERSIDRSSDEIHSSALNFEESIFLQNNNTELLTDIQMNDESLLTESPEKSSMIDSFHSIESNHVHEDNKRKMEATKEHDYLEKKMKVETEILKTPMSMLYKIKNIFRSSERQPSCANNMKENNFKSSKLNFNKFEENNDDFTKPGTLKKSEVLTKSRIPCKVIDRSLAKNDEFHNSSLSSLNDSIKQKKAIPKFSGVPVLSDVSNSSNRKCAESRIPSKFQK